MTTEAPTRPTTWRVALHRSDPRFKVLRFSRNFGHQVALSAGLDAASGDAVVTMDGDLQHPPEVIPDLVARWRSGAQVVYGVMAERQGESRFKAIAAKAFYGTLTKLADIDVPTGAGDFRLVDRAVLEAYRAMRESHRYLRGMFSWMGFDQAGVEYASPPRVAGRSKYSTGRMVRLATDAIVELLGSSVAARVEPRVRRLDRLDPLRTVRVGVSSRRRLTSCPDGRRSWSSSGSSAASS